MLNIAVLGSTKGTDLQPIIDAVENGKLKDVKISVVISNKQDAFILERAKKHNLEAIFVDSKEDFDKEVDKILEEKQVELILLIGYMKIMSSEFVQKWLNKVMNIHPSLLPAFAGGMDLNVHEEVLKRGCKVSGCSLIFIDEGADTGPIIIQKACDVENDEAADSLKTKVQKLEGEALIEGIELFRDNKLKVENAIVKVLT